MIRQGTLVKTDHAKKISSEKIATGNFSEIIHLHLKKDSVLQEHLSRTDAVLIVVSGEIDYISNEKRYNLNQSDYICFAANLPHSVEAIEEAHLILIK